jgi:hypothetical protein
MSVSTLVIALAIELGVGSLIIQWISKATHSERPFPHIL